MNKNSKGANVSLKAEFRKRLVRLRTAIDFALKYDCAGGDVLPALFSCLTYLWCNSDYEKANPKPKH